MGNEITNTTREHYIPRAAFLRRFSDTSYSDDKKNSICCYNVENKTHFISNVYQVGYENGLYECDWLDRNSVENILRDIETDYKPELDRLIGICNNPNNEKSLILNNENERENLKFFLTLQYYRTPKKRSEYEARTKEERQRLFLGALIGKAPDGIWWIKKNTLELAKHYFVFERNKTQTPFVVSDQPILLFKTDGSEKKLNYRFPLTPTIQVFLINPDSKISESMQQWRNRIKIIKESDDETVKAWNRIAADNSRLFVYYPPNSPEVF